MGKHSKEQMLRMKSECHERLEPFYPNFASFQQAKVRYYGQNGLKYYNLANDLKNDGADPYLICTCYKKAYDMSPYDNTHFFNYILALMEIDETELVQTICIEKLRLHRNKKIK